MFTISRVLSSIRSVNLISTNSFHISAPSLLKTRKTVAKRIKINGSGNLKVCSPNKSHLNSHKSSERINRLNSKKFLEGTLEKNMRSLLQKF